MADSSTASAATGPLRAAPPTSLRGRLSQLAPAIADALRAFHGQTRRWSSDGGNLRLRAAQAPTAGPADDALIELDADGARIAVRLHTGGGTAPDDALHWQDYQGRARVLAWSLAHESPLMRLSEALGTSLLPRLEPDIAPVGDVAWLDFTLASDAGGIAPLTGTLRLPVDWLDRLATRAQPSGPADLGHWRQLPAPVRIALTVPPLTADDYRSLRPGDVVVVGNSRLPPLVASAAGLRWPVRPGNDGWCVDGPASPATRHAEPAPSRLETPPMTQQDDAPDTAADDTSTNDTPAAAVDPAGRLPVQLEFDIGTVELTLGDIAGLQPGYVFALPTHLEGANVALRANGRVVGQGELVAVGDTLGVRLLSWS